MLSSAELESALGMEHLDSESEGDDFDPNVEHQAMMAEQQR